MAGELEEFATAIARTLRTLKHRTPSRTSIYSALDIAYIASMTSEEGRHVRGSLTFASPARPELNPPVTRRACHPEFCRLGKHLPLTPDTFTKLSRAVDTWSGSIAIWTHSSGSLFAWGILDQLVHYNTGLNHESRRGGWAPGVLTINITGVGELVAYCGGFFIGALRRNRLVLSESDALSAPPVVELASSAIAPIALRIAASLGKDDEQRAIRDIRGSLLRQWRTTVARLCIGTRRLGTGGAFLISTCPREDALDIGYPFDYPRLGDAAWLSVLDALYAKQCDSSLRTARSGPISYLDVIEARLAETDEEDRHDELTGAVRLVTSLAAIDGLVLLSAALQVKGFGVKIRSSQQVPVVHDGGALFSASPATRDKRPVDISRLGMRHLSMLRYCALDPDAIGVVVSQDGGVRIIKRCGVDLVMWQETKLLGYRIDALQEVESSQRTREYRKRRRRQFRRGYTMTPKTMTELMDITRDR